jgi:ABC-type sugar transport system ATPase subunit
MYRGFRWHGCALEINDTLHRSKIDALAAQGMGILLISSELPKIIGMSDRILVMRKKRIVREFNRHEFSEQAIGSCAIADRP